MTAVVLGVADAGLSASLRTTLSEIEGVEVGHVATSTSELATAVDRLKPGVVFVHDQLGPDPVWPLIRDIGFRRPGCAVLVIAAGPEPEVFARALEVGARGVVSAPVSYDDIRARLAGAADWAEQMQRLLPGTVGDDGRGSVVVFAGGKGGVGATTIATHLALDAVRLQPGRRVCLVDLDLEKGDVTGLLDVRQGRSIADLAKVAADLSPFTVPDAVVSHESGLHLLLTPADVRDVEAVSLVAVRQIVSVLRSEYELVIVDAGSHCTPMQATLVDLADEVVAVATPDVLCLRSLRRLLSAWDTLGVRREADVRVLLNRVSPSAVSPADVARMVHARVMAATLPATYRHLEPAVNARDPLLVRDKEWALGLGAVSRELELWSGRVNGNHYPVAAGGAHRRGRWRSASGSVSIETVGLLPLVLAAVVLSWQVVLFGLTMVWSGHAAGAGARALSVGRAPGPAARGAVPSSMAGDVTVTPEAAGATDTVTVTVATPLLAPGFGRLPLKVTSTRAVVVEP
ncbi:MAG TPA: AAA family ATPase [Acidimicrobiales bacterium]|nr:AAA family ATPase [Acidimicrobiales bacterium]